MMRQRRDVVVHRVASIRGLSLEPPAGTFYAWIDCSELIGNDRPFGSDGELAEHLLDKAGVAVMPGSAFLGENAIRISFATSIETLERAFDRIGRSLEGLA